MNMSGCPVANIYEMQLTVTTLLTNTFLDVCPEGSRIRLYNATAFTYSTSFYE